MRELNLYAARSTLPRREEIMGYKVAGIDVHKKVLMVVVYEVSDQQHLVAEHF